MRRKFLEAQETAPKVALWFLPHFHNLYRLEEKLRQARRDRSGGPSRAPA